MKTIYCFAVAIILLFSCKKNKEEAQGMNENTVRNIAGQWNASYLGNSLHVAIDAENKFSMDLPVIVKKESNSKPVTLLVHIEGVCVQQDGLYELQGTGFSVPDDAGPAGGQAASSIFQSLAGIDLTIQRDTAKLACRITAVDYHNPD
jgi:hypothetical protein